MKKTWLFSMIFVVSHITLNGSFTMIWIAVNVGMLYIITYTRGSNKTKRLP